ncbi:hypothetical protein V2G26_015668 [Clonostachys chloroleuca]
MISPEDSSEAHSSSSLRRRKWHPRVFTGCDTCRRRHVKCDGQLPTCANCTRLSLSCENPGRIVFKTVRPLNYRSTWKDLSPIQRGVAEPATPLVISTADGGDPEPLMESEEVHVEDGQFAPWLTAYDSGRRSSDATSFFDQENSLDLLAGFAILSPTPTITSPETIYYGHFMTTVSTVLIIYDNPSNSNPYRLLPQLSETSDLLPKSMIALGALHLANTTSTRDKQQHGRAAMETYAAVVSQFRTALAENPIHSNLEQFATSLLLCIYEKMASTSRMWQVHLAGARQVFEAIYSPKVVASGADYGKDEWTSSISVPMRRFLISLLSFLDVAACCATGEDTVILGDYWESFAGGWEYNLGTPSFCLGRASADRTLAQIRQAWSRIMSIQVGISAFARLQRLSIHNSRRNTLHNDLAHRIEVWQASVPDIFHRLAALSTMPSDASDRDAEILTAAACIECYSVACIIHLDRVATQSLGNAATNPEIAAATNRILDLILNFSNGLNRMGVLWPLLMAGIATVDKDQQSLVRDCLAGLKVFGLQHVSRALDTLEYVWLQHRLFGKANYKEFDDLAAENLLP